MIFGDVGGLIFFTKSNIMHNFASKIFLLLENCQLIEGLHFVGIKHIIMLPAKYLKTGLKQNSTCQMIITSNLMVFPQHPSRHLTDHLQHSGTL